MNTMIGGHIGAIGKPQQKKRVALAIQGGGFPAGALRSRCRQRLVDKGALDKYDICAFSGTSAGALAGDRKGGQSVQVQLCNQNSW
jgi:hypothetical protein